MLDELIELEKTVAPQIDGDHWTLIAPANPATFDLFLELAYKRLHVSNVIELQQKKSQVHKMLRTMNPEIQLDVYVLSKSDSSGESRELLKDYLDSRRSSPSQ